MLITLILLLAVEAQKNRAPVCAIGLKKGARVRLPQGARKASPALQIRVRKQLPIPIIPGAHVATLKDCRTNVGAFRQTCCALPAALPFVHNGTEPFNTTAVAGQVGRYDECEFATVLPDADARDVGAQGGLGKGGRRTGGLCCE